MGNGESEDSEPEPDSVPMDSPARGWLRKCILESYFWRHCHETRSCLYTLCFGCGWLRAAEQRSGLERSEGDPSPPGKKPGRCRRGDACGQIRLQTYAAADELCPSRPSHYRIEQLPLCQGWRCP